VSWWALELSPPAEARDALAAWLVERTGQAVEDREDGPLVAFADSDEACAALEAALRDAHPGLETSPRELPTVDWATAWREGLGPRRFGRLVVSPSWVEASLAPGEVLVRLDPEMAFGSGEHGSTRAALLLLERLMAPGDVVFDLGSGSGILAIAARLLGASRTVGIEVDAEAIPVAERNAVRNGVPDVQFLGGDAAVLVPLLGRADIVLSNILLLINVALLPEVRLALRPGGIAIFSGMEEGEADSFLPELAGADFTPVAEARDGGWWAVAARA
jgi:ribosomal protein L11 methyltransferase